MLWTKKYAPKNLDEFVNQEDAVNKVRSYLENFLKGKKGKAILLYGPPGVGKTSLAYAAAKTYNMRVIELNASDTRDSKTIKNIIGSASKQMSLFSQRNLILIDEIDGISTKEDRGGLTTLIKIIKETSNPVIVTANDPWNKKFSPLREVCDFVQMKKLGVYHIYRVLKRICERENLSYDEKAIKLLATNSKGDLRAAILDLQSLSSLGKITVEAVQQLGYRERELSIFEALTIVFKSTSGVSALGAFNNVEKDFDEIILWLDKNIPEEYEDIEELERAYDSLSKADIYKGRIYRKQYYRFQAYMNIFLTYGVAIAKKERYRKFTKMKAPDRILKLWRYKQSNSLREEIITQLSKKVHLSTYKTRREVMPIVERMIKAKPELANKFARWLRLSEEHFSYIKKLQI